MKLKNIYVHVRVLSVGEVNCVCVTCTIDTFFCCLNTENKTANMLSLVVCTVMQACVHADCRFSGTLVTASC